jgi:hypothetical protein
MVLLNTLAAVPFLLPGRLVLCKVSLLSIYNSMDMINSSAVSSAIALVFIAAVITNVAWGRITADPASRNTPPHPPAVSGSSIIPLLHTLVTKGFRAMLQEQYTKFGSVFTISLGSFLPGTRV